MFDEITSMLNNKESNDNARRKQTFETSNKGFYKKLYFNLPYRKYNSQDAEMDKSRVNDEDDKDGENVEDDTDRDVDSNQNEVNSQENNKK